MTQTMKKKYSERGELAYRPKLVPEENNPQFEILLL